MGGIDLLCRSSASSAMVLNTWEIFLRLNPPWKHISENIWIVYIENYLSHCIAQTSDEQDWGSGEINNFVSCVHTLKQT